MEKYYITNSDPLSDTYIDILKTLNIFYSGIKFERGEIYLTTQILTIYKNNTHIDISKTKYDNIHFLKPNVNFNKDFFHNKFDINTIVSDPIIIDNEHYYLIHIVDNLYYLFIFKKESISSLIIKKVFKKSYFFVI